MTAFWKKYFALRQRNARIAWDRAKHMKFCYAFLAPYALLFLTFYILPMLISIYYSFTYNNILEPARFIGMDNYITLILKDDVFLTAVKNTFLLAVITGPVGYIMSFCFAWLINELPRAGYARLPSSSSTRRPLRAMPTTSSPSSSAATRTAT